MENKNKIQGLPLEDTIIKNKDTLFSLDELEAIMRRDEEDDKNGVEETYDSPTIFTNREEFFKEEKETVEEEVSVEETSALEETPTIEETTLEESVLEETQVEETPVVEEVKEEIKEEVKDSKKDKKKKEKKEKKPKEKKPKKEKVKKPVNKAILACQIIFCSLSVIFILGCMYYYGSRMIKYYKIYNPKTEDGEVIELLGNSITTNSSLVTSGEGLYRVSGQYIYKGENVDNYVLFGNNLWRITRVNSDGSLELVSEYINALNWNKEITTYSDSDIRKYLNDVFLKTLDKDMLIETSYCADIISDINSVTCKESIREDYVRLLGITEFLNSQVDGKTFINTTSDNIWLYNSSEEEVWHISGSNVSSSKSDNGYLIKAVVTVKNSVTLLKGKGTKEEPYIIEKNKDVRVGSYVKLDEDVWYIYDKTDDVYKLALTTTLDKTYRFSIDNNVFNVESKNSLANYLNTTYLNSLSYKDKLVDTTWYIGGYTDSYEDVEKVEATAKVGLLNVKDLKYGLNTSDTYFLSTSGEAEYNYVVSDVLRPSKMTISRDIKPTIGLSNIKAKSGSGTLADPFIVEE